MDINQIQQLLEINTINESSNKFNNMLNLSPESISSATKTLKNQFDLDRSMDDKQKNFMSDMLALISDELEKPNNLSGNNAEPANFQSMFSSLFQIATSVANKISVKHDMNDIFNEARAEENDSDPSNENNDMIIDNVGECSNDDNGECNTETNDDTISIQI